MVEIHGQKHDWVLFEEDEWKVLQENYGRIKNYFVTENGMQCPSINIGTKTIQFQCLGQKKVIAIQSGEGSEVWLAAESAQELITLVPLINRRIEVLKALEVETFYKNLIKGVAAVSDDWQAVIHDVLANLTGIKSENPICILELLKYAPEIVQCDIELERIGQEQRFEPFQM